MSNFPDIGSQFISKCEKNELFPNRIFDTSQKFETLNTSTLSDISNDHLIKLIELSMPSSENNSFIFKKNPSSQIPISDQLLLGNMQPLTIPEKNSSSIEICAHFETISQILFDKTQQLLITGSSDSFIKIWHLPELHLVTTLSSHDNNITHIALNPQNSLLFSTGTDKTLCVFSMTDGAFRQRINLKANILDLCVSPNGNYLAASFDDGLTRVWRILQEKNKIDPNVEFNIHGSNITTKIVSVQFFNDDILMMTSELSEVISISLSKKKYFSKHCNEEGTVEAVYASNGDILASLPKKKNLILISSKYRTFDYVLLPVYKEKLKVRGFAYNADESFIFAVSHSKFIIFRREDFSVFSQCVIFEDEILTCLAPHPKEPMIAFVGTNFGNAAVLDLNSYKKVQLFSMKSNSKVALAKWSDDGNHLAFCDDLGNLILYGIECEKVVLREQFMGKELNLNSNDSKVFDGTGNPVEPQPPSFKLQNMKLNLSIKPGNTISNAEIDISDWIDFNSNDKIWYCSKTEALRIPVVNTSPQKPEKKYNIFLNNDSSENDNGNTESDEEVTSLPQWTYQTKQEQHFYIPQVGEEIVYFRQGHQFASRLFNDAQLRKPYEYKPSMPRTAFGQIIAAKFAITHFILTIAFHNMSNLVCDIPFHLPDSVPFIVPLWIYKESLNFISKLRVGSTVFIPYLEDDGLKHYEAMIEEFAPDISNNPFESITVGFVEGGDQAKVSPWEIELDDLKPPETIISKIQENLLETVDKLIEMYPVYHKVRYSNIDDILLLASQQPMDLSLFRDRIENKWYYTIEELTKEAGLFGQNAGLIGIPEDIGNQITRMIRTEISRKI